MTYRRPKLSCAMVRAEIDLRMDRVAKHEAAIAEIVSRCAHDETREERDYQDSKPYRRCLGCGKGLP